MRQVLPSWKVPLVHVRQSLASPPEQVLQLESHAWQRKLESA